MALEAEWERYYCALVLEFENCLRRPITKAEADFIKWMALKELSERETIK
ncbi:hypothetical protein ACFO4N_12360 [Camelliibacillus cellulosilyticus]|uniref:Uncharacterized protein n=1 Tax=Camelliibacillus cellulosilyticus TaxID=2174486 RepID=A0ABV9GS82_9BACL